MVLITVITGVYKPTCNWGASHCIYIYIYIMFILVFGRTVELQKTAGFCDLALIRAENMDI